jgi:hypothetical protein
MTEVPAGIAIVDSGGGGVGVPDTGVASGTPGIELLGGPRPDDESAASSGSLQVGSVIGPVCRNGADQLTMVVLERDFWRATTAAGRK